MRGRVSGTHDTLPTLGAGVEGAARLTTGFGSIHNPLLRFGAVCTSGGEMGPLHHTQPRHKACLFTALRTRAGRRAGGRQPTNQPSEPNQPEQPTKEPTPPATNQPLPLTPA